MMLDCHITTIIISYNVSMSLNHALIVLVLKLYWFTNQDNGIEITGNYWRLLEITGDYLVLLEITGDYLVFLSQSYTLLQLLLPSIH